MEEAQEMQGHTLMRQTLLEALLSVQLLRANVQQTIRDMQAEGAGAAGGRGTLRSQPIQLGPTALEATSDCPGPPSPSPQHEAGPDTMYPHIQQGEQAFSNVLFQNVLYQDAWASCQDEEGGELSSDRAYAPSDEGFPHAQIDRSPLLTHSYSPAINARAYTSWTTPPKASSKQLAASTSAMPMDKGRTTPLRAALDKLNDTGKNGDVGAFVFESPPQADRDFQRSARSSMDAASFLVAAHRGTLFPRKSFNGGSSNLGSGTLNNCSKPSSINDHLSHSNQHPSARKNLEKTSLSQELD